MLTSPVNTTQRFAQAVRPAAQPQQPVQFQGGASGLTSRMNNWTKGGLISGGAGAMLMDLTGVFSLWTFISAAALGGGAWAIHKGGSRNRNEGSPDQDQTEPPQGDSKAAGFLPNFP